VSSGSDRSASAVAAAPAPAVPDVVAPPPRHPRFPLFDGLRAVAALTVLLAHVAVFSDATGSSAAGRLLAHANIGVTVFFLISGFLLYRPFAAHRAGGAGAPRVADYAKRRALRILPAYWLALVVLTVALGLLGTFGSSWWSQFGIVHTLVGADPNCAADPFRCGLPQTWSLVVEVTFYALLPVYALLSERLWRARPHRSWVVRELVLIGALASASIALAFTEAGQGVGAWATAGAFGFMLWFGLGMGLAVLSVIHEGEGRAARLAGFVGSRPLLPWLAAAGLYVLVCWTTNPNRFLPTNGDQLWIHVAFGAIAALLLLPAVFGDRSGGAPRRLLSNRVVAWLGLVSYGIFLWHFPIAYELGFGGLELGFWVVLAGTLAITIPCAAISYYVVERPLLRLKYRRIADLPIARRLRAAATQGG
jgi:peptidoglycan/LPS O-acetylase OafA/YrhL